MDDKVRRELIVQTWAAVCSIVAAYAGAKLWGALRDEDDPVLGVWNRTKAAIADGRETYRETRDNLAGLAATIERARDITKEGCCEGGPVLGHASDCFTLLLHNPSQRPTEG